ncbi:MAG: phosphotransferase [Actinomycetota bacterium]|nr:phosphotransferase [Actinomycetota bacterium]
MTSQDVRRVLAAHLPEYRVESVERLGEGWENIAYEVNDEVIVRFTKSPDTAVVEREGRLLATVAEIVSLAVPAPLFVSAADGCMAYRKVPGVPLLDLPIEARAPHAAAVGAELGRMLAELHAIPVERMACLVGQDADPLTRWHSDAVEEYATVGGLVPERHRAAVERYLAAPVPDERFDLVFSHNDLGIEHVLVDPVSWAVTGVIDWSDAAIVDPAYDFGLILRDLGPVALDAALGTVDDRFRERAVFYARASVFNDLTYGVDMGKDAYVEKCVAAMEWLFPAR